MDQVDCVFTFYVSLFSIYIYFHRRWSTVQRPAHYHVADFSDVCCLFQLEDGYKVFDYNINLNDVVMLMVKPDPSAFQSSANTAEEKPEDSSEPTTSKEVVCLINIFYFFLPALYEYVFFQLPFSMYSYELFLLILG